MTINNIGASTANFYPLETERSLDKVLGSGFKHIEIFLNSESETSEAFSDLFKEKVERHKASVIAIHAFTSAYEPFLFYSNYERRLHDGLNIYDKIYKLSKNLGAKYVVMHGDRVTGKLSYDESIARFKRVAELGEQYGVTLLLENVFNFRGSEMQYIAQMREKIGHYANFVFDIKQCYRSSCDYKKIIEAMGDSLKHIHVSDNNKDRECILPGRGTFDYVSFFGFLKDVGYSGKYMIELYRESFEGEKDLEKAALFLESQLKLI